jgi:hypothetical protein
MPESLNGISLTLDFYPHALGGVGDPSAQPKIPGQPINSRTKPHALHGSSNIQALSDRLGQPSLLRIGFYDT